MWYIYMVRCSDSSLYTGIATDVARRFAEHAAQGKQAAKYLRGKDPLTLVFAVEVGSRAEASRLEAKVKRLAKIDKEELIKGVESLASLGLI